MEPYPQSLRCCTAAPPDRSQRPVHHPRAIPWPHQDVPERLRIPGRPGCGWRVPVSEARGHLAHGYTREDGVCCPADLRSLVLTDSHAMTLEAVSALAAAELARPRLPQPRHGRPSCG